MERCPLIICNNFFRLIIILPWQTKQIKIATIVKKEKVGMIVGDIPVWPIFMEAFAQKMVKSERAGR